MSFADGAFLLNWIADLDLSKVDVTNKYPDRKYWSTLLLRIEMIMRTYQHIIDTASVKLTLNSLPDYWVIRDLNERDYGIDLMIEIFTKSGFDKQGHETYDATGQICYLQIKGTNF